MNDNCTILNEDTLLYKKSVDNNPGHILSRAVITLIIEPATINSDEFLVFCSSEGVSKFRRPKNET